MLRLDFSWLDHAPKVTGMTRGLVCRSGLGTAEQQLRPSTPQRCDSRTLELSTSSRARTVTDICRPMVQLHHPRGGEHRLNDGAGGTESSGWRILHSDASVHLTLCSATGVAGQLKRLAMWPHYSTPSTCNHWRGCSVRQRDQQPNQARTGRVSPVYLHDSSARLLRGRHQELEYMPYLHNHHD